MIKIVKERVSIGTLSQDGKLKVIDIQRDNRGRAILKVECSECSKDTELFPSGYFIIRQDHFKNGIKPCGCGKNVRWIDDQFLIKVQRIGEKKQFIVHGFAEDFHGANTKINCECLIDGNKWTPTINNVINNDHGCVKCAGKYNQTEQEALEKCKKICDEMNYEVVGFSDGYKNAKSKFKYKCSKHNIQSVVYNNFVNSGSRCPDCWKDRQRELGGFYGWYPERAEEQDYLYVLNFDDQYIKVGRSFDLDDRTTRLIRDSCCHKITRIYIYTGLHKDVYPFEQKIHNNLRELCFDYIPNNWYSVETFINDSVPVVKELLENSQLIKIE